MSAIGVRRTAASVLDIVDAQLVAADPAACAVRAGAGELTWRELDGRAWAVAAALASRGTAAGQFVPVLAARGGALVAAWIGVLRTGAAYAPLSLDTPPHRIGYVLAELGARVVLVDRAGEALLGDLPAPVDAVRIDELAEAAPGERVAPRPGSPAVVIYTSGTSGRPKGVVVLHHGLLNTALWWADDVDVRAEDRVLCTWATGFDGATHEVFRSLVAGAELVFADDVERRDPRALAALLRGPRGATVTSMTPSLLRAVLDVDEGGPTTLRTLYVGGEALPARLAEECSRRWAVPIRNIYGPTEASCISTVCPVDLAGGQPPAIGVPLPNTRAYVVGPDLEELPAGVPGELYVAGTGVAGGYLAQPGLTAEAFLPDPYGDGAGARMYRTGDRVVLRADGLIEHLGRVDDQVKILGNRIEPNEVRELLEEQPAVRAAAVRAVGDPLRLEAYVELAGTGQPPTRDEVVGPLLRWLPPAVLPADVFVVDALPMTGNDKIDFQALAGMRSARLRDAPARPVELGPDERLAAGLFEAALAEADRPAANLAATLAPAANFFMLGGHSLLAVRLLAEAERRGLGPVPMRDFLADPTVAGLGRLLGRGGERAEAAGVAAGERFPATSAQQRFWFLDRIPSQRPAYLIPTVVELTGGVDRAALAAATAAVLARHPALRSRFELDRKLRQVFVRTDGPAPEVARVDAAGWSDEALHEHLANACWSPLDLAGGTPVRAQVIAAGDRTLLLLVVHHIVSDGWSQGLLLDQVAEVYRASIEGRDPDLPPPVHPSRLVDPAPAESIAERVAGVVAALGGAPTDVRLPHDRARGDEQSTAAAAVAAALTPAVAGRLRGLAEALGVTPFMIVAALLAVALARRTGQRDLLLAFPWAGREAPGSAAAVGLLVNTLVLRADLRDGPTWRELLGRVRAASIAAYRHAGVPFDAVAAALHPGRDLSRPPLTPVYLDVRDRAHAPPDLGPGVAARWRPLDPVHVKFELELTATAGAAGWELAAAYPVALFDAGTASGLLDALVAAAADLTDDPDARPLGRLP